MSLKQDEVAKPKTEALSWRTFFKSVLAASIANGAQIVTTHPLDTLKVRMQMSREKLTMTQCFRQVVRHEGYSALTKGLS